MMRRIALGSLAAVAVAALASALPPQDPWALEKKDPKFADVDWAYAGDPPQQLLDMFKAQGPALYQRFCVQCHGVEGEGDGELSDALIPRPRNFKKGVFKGRSSHPEMPPTATDIQRSLVHGIPLSAMLSYSFIGNEDQLALLGQVRSLAADHFPKGFGFPLKSGNFHRDAGMPLPTAETIARGRALFDRFSCIACHGPAGDGKGPVAATLSDTGDGRPSNVRNLTQGIYSGGPNVRHMYLRVSGGVQGTVMPPFATSTSVEDRWALAHYVMALSKRSKDLPLPHSEPLIVKKVAALPKGPSDPAWSALEGIPLPPKEAGPFVYEVQPVYVMPLYFQQTRHNPERPYFTEATVRGLHDGITIAFRLEWQDTASDPSDRIEIQVSPSRSPGFVIYGSATDPTNVWRWEGKDPKAVVEIDAEGLFKMTPRAAATVLVESDYDAANKRWVVVFTRPLAGAGPKDATFEKGMFNPILFLMKDGGEAWPQGTRELKEDPDDGPEENKKVRDREAVRVKDEKAIEAKFKDLPRHLTTWHFVRPE